jgi:ferredoxin
MTWSISVDRERCIGSGICVTLAPGTFDQDDTATCVLRDPLEDPLERVRSAVEACPTRALAIDDPDQKEAP